MMNSSGMSSTVSKLQFNLIYSLTYNIYKFVNITATKLRY